jgi:hypothetical protein
MLVVVCLFAVSLQVGAQDQAREGEEEAAKPKHAIKDVMQTAHSREGVLRKVLGGEASQEEKLALLDLYVSLTENEPPRGEKEAWDTKVNAIVLAAAKVAVGREGSSQQLQRATNCMACHREHRPPQQ